MTGGQLPSDFKTFLADFPSALLGWNHPVPDAWANHLSGGGSAGGALRQPVTGGGAATGGAVILSPSAPSGVSLTLTGSTSSSSGTLETFSGSDGSHYYYNPGSTSETIATPGGPMVLGPGQTAGFSPDGMNMTFLSAASSMEQWSDDPNYDLDTWVLQN